MNKVEMQSKEKRLLEIIIQKGVEKKAEGFVLVSGIKSNLYIDLRKVSLDPEGSNLIASLILAKIKEISPDAGFIGGLETGSIPISTAVSMLSNNDPKPLNAFWVRKKLKDHGMQNLIEGNIEKGGKVVIVDDVITTGGSSFQAANAVKDFGAKVIQVITLVDRGATENFRKAGIPYFAFFSEKDLDK